jgi:type II secretory pathway pseudopilin PulG
MIEGGARFSRKSPALWQNGTKPSLNWNHGRRIASLPEGKLYCEVVFQTMRLVFNRYSKYGQRGFSLVEVAVAAGLIGLMFVALLSGLTSSVANIQFGREQMRATQIMVEKMDIIRLYSWENLNPTYIPTSFTTTFHPDSGTSGGKNGGGEGVGTTYFGSIAITNTAVVEPYAPDLKQVTVSLEWKSGNRTVTRQMSTYVARYGLQNFIK